MATVVNLFFVFMVTSYICWPNVQAKAARATTEPANQRNARGARSLFGRKLGIGWPFSVLELSKLSPEPHRNPFIAAPNS